VTHGRGGQGGGGGSSEQPEQGRQLGMTSDITCCCLVLFSLFRERALDSISYAVVDEVKMRPVKRHHSKLEGKLEKK